MPRARPGRFARLPTEQADPRTRGLDRRSPADIARLMNRADAEAVRAVGRARPAVVAAAEMVRRGLAGGGRLIFVGAGTSGRLGVLEAAECPPTFGVAPARVRAVMAGGPRAVFRSREGAEDDARAGTRAMRRLVRVGDVVVGVTASGVTPFVRAALVEARRRRAATVLVTCNPGVGRAAARRIVALATGPEVLAGSTRLKAGTATKLALNALTTVAFTRLGLVRDNRMLAVVPRSAKLRARAARLVQQWARVGRAEAERLLARAGGRVERALRLAPGRGWSSRER